MDFFSNIWASILDSIVQTFREWYYVIIAFIAAILAIKAAWGVFKTRALHNYTPSPEAMARNTVSQARNRIQNGLGSAAARNPAGVLLMKVVPPGTPGRDAAIVGCGCLTGCGCLGGIFGCLFTPIMIVVIIIAVVIVNVLRPTSDLSSSLLCENEVFIDCGANSDHPAINLNDPPLTDSMILQYEGIEKTTGVPWFLLAAYERVQTSFGSKVQEGGVGLPPDLIAPFYRDVQANTTDSGDVVSEDYMHIIAGLSNLDRENRDPGPELLTSPRNNGSYGLNMVTYEEWLAHGVNEADRTKDRNLWNRTDAAWVLAGMMKTYWEETRTDWNNSLTTQQQEDCRFHFQVFGENICNAPDESFDEFIAEFYTPYHTEGETVVHGKLAEPEDEKWLELRRRLYQFFGSKKFFGEYQNAIIELPGLNDAGEADENLPTRKVNVYAEAMLSYAKAYYDYYQAKLAAMAAQEAALKSWAQLTTLPVGLTNADAVVAYDNLMYVGPGTSSEGVTNIIYYYDIVEKGEWKQLPPVPQGVSGSQLVFAANQLYVIGGVNAAGATQDSVYRLTLNSDTGAATGAWETLEPLPEARTAGQAWFANGVIYYYGGTAEAASGPLDGADAEEELFWTSSVSRDAKVTWVGSSTNWASRSHAGFLTTKNTLYVIGGFNENGDLQDSILTAPLEDLPIGESGSVPSLSEAGVKLEMPTASSIAFFKDDYIYISGGLVGNDEETALTDKGYWLRFNTENGQIVERQPSINLLMPTSSATAITYSNQALYAGGSTQTANGELAISDAVNTVFVLGPGLLGQISVTNSDIPLFWRPILEAAGAKYNIPWQYLAASMKIETDFGRLADGSFVNTDTSAIPVALADTVQKPSPFEGAFLCNDGYKEFLPSSKRCVTMTSLYNATHDMGWVQFNIRTWLGWNYDPNSPSTWVGYGFDDANKLRSPYNPQYAVEQMAKMFRENYNRQFNATNSDQPELWEAYSLWSMYNTGQACRDTWPRIEVEGEEVCQWAYSDLALEHARIYLAPPAVGDLGDPSAYGFIWPNEGVVSSGFQVRGMGAYFYHVNSKTGVGGCYHDGIDIAAARGTPIVAPQSGYVHGIRIDSAGAYIVTIAHPNGFISSHAHVNSRIEVSKGQRVTRGQLIAYVDTTGFSTGPHNHFSFIRYNVDTGAILFETPPVDCGGGWGNRQQQLIDPLILLPKDPDRIFLNGSDISQW